MRRLVALSLLATGLLACPKPPPEARARFTQLAGDPPMCEDRNPLRNLYWGDLHVHTELSFDAWVNGVRGGPSTAYGFARGEEVRLPPLDASGVGTLPVRIDRPLDFVAVTDHAEYFGEVNLCTVPGAPGYDDPDCVAYRDRTQAAIFGFGVRISAEDPVRFDFCGDGATDCLERTASVWQRVQQAAADADDPCDFTAFVGYEYTGATNASNLHRNVIFRNAAVPADPISYFEAPTASHLWQGLDNACRQAGTGCQVLTIPHNSNLSNGNLLAVDDGGDPNLRHALEPLIEVFQHKGDSECVPGLSTPLSGPDELCNFEKVLPAESEDCGDTPGWGGLSGFGCLSRNDFLRGALTTGLAEEARIGVNPLKLGVIASTDTHTATPGAVRESDWQGHFGVVDSTPVGRLAGETLPPGGVLFGPGGLAAVWAVENTRDAIFEALARRETYGTSGPRFAVRMFAGPKLPKGLCESPKLVKKGYRFGVPMGSDLPAGGAPRFVIQALADPAEEAAPLWKVQVVKGHLDESGAPVHEVFDVLVDDGDFDTDPDTCVSTGTGASSLCTEWVDPGWVEGQAAWYYARIVAHPTCRWSAALCETLPEASRPASCSDPAVPRLVHERAWTSPVWAR